MNIRNSRFLPILTGILYAIIYGISTPLSKYALNFFRPMQVNAMRFCFAGVFIIILVFLKVIKLHITKKNLPRLILVGLLMPITYYTFDILALSMIPASVEGMVQGAQPAIIAVLSFLILKNRVSKKQVVFITLSILGAIFINIFNTSGDVRPLGLLFLIFSVSANSLYPILSKKAMNDDVCAIDLTFVSLIMGAIFFSLVSIIENPISPAEYFLPFKDPKAVLVILYLGVISNCCGMFLSYFTLSKVSPTQNAIFTNLIIIVCVLVGILFLGESFHWFYLVGIPLIGIGVWGTLKFSPKCDIMKKNTEEIEGK